MQKGSFSTLRAVQFWIPACAGKTGRARHRTFAYFSTLVFPIGVGVVFNIVFYFDFTPIPCLRRGRL